LGRLHVYTGDGKGKTSMAMGMAMRALGHGQRVVIIQFLKGQETGEQNIKNFNKKLIFKKFGSKNFIFEKKNQTDYTIAVDAVNFTLNILKTKPNLIILDEINVALNLGLISLDSAMTIINSCPKNTELVFTGRGAPKKILDIADLVTEMKNLKHYFNRGDKAKKGIEY